LKAIDLVNCAAADAELAWLLEAAFAIEPIPCNEGPLSAASSAMAARKQRIFFIGIPFPFAFQANYVHFLSL